MIDGKGVESAEELMKWMYTTINFNLCAFGLLHSYLIQYLKVIIIYLHTGCNRSN